MRSAEDNPSVLAHKIQIVISLQSIKWRTALPVLCVHIMMQGGLVIMRHKHLVKHLKLKNSVSKFMLRLSKTEHTHFNCHYI